MADKLWTELWNEMTLHLPLTVTPSDNKTPSYVTTLQNKVTALTPFYTKTRGEYKKYLEQGETTIDVITDIKNWLKEKQVLEDQLKDNEMSLDKLLDKAATAKLAFKAASASVKEKRTELSHARQAEKSTSILLTAHRKGGHTFTKAMKAKYEYKDWVHPT
jgi:chromosome segregation ATPase